MRARRRPQQRSERLDRALLSCSLAATGLLLARSEAHAQVVTRQIEETLSPSFGKELEYMLDMDGDGTTDFLIKASASESIAASTTATTYSFWIAASSPNDLVGQERDGIGEHVALRLQAGDVVDDTSSLNLASVDDRDNRRYISHFRELEGCWLDRQPSSCFVHTYSAGKWKPSSPGDGFVAVQFPSGGNAVYGWIEISSGSRSAIDIVSVGYDPSGAPVTIPGDATARAPAASSARPPILTWIARGASGIAALRGGKPAG